MDPLFRPLSSPPLPPLLWHYILCPSGLRSLTHGSLRHSPCRPPASRLWASSAAEAQLILTARRLETWLRRSASNQLHCVCRYAAQQQFEASAGGASCR